jgi:membrane-associated phospholipid phosphatase
MKRVRTNTLLSVTLVPYLLAFTVSWTFAATAMLAIGNGTFFLWVNSHGTFFLDQVASAITWLGDGFTYAILCLVLLVIDRVKGIAALLAYALSSAVAQIFKHLLFSSWDRPAGFFEAKGIGIRVPEGFQFEIAIAKTINPMLEAAHITLQLPEIYALHHYNSFPSGHAVSAFSMACLLAFFYPKPKLQLFFLLLAWTISLTRVYLGQHFPLDILGGALIGTACSVLVRDVFFKWGFANRFVSKPHVP